MIISVQTAETYKASETQLLKDVTAQLFKDEADLIQFTESVQKRNRSFLYFSKQREEVDTFRNVTFPLLYGMDISKLRIDPVVVSSIENFEFKRSEISLKCTAILSDYQYAQHRIDQLEEEMQK